MVRELQQLGRLLSPIGRWPNDSRFLLAMESASSTHGNVHEGDRRHAVVRVTAGTPKPSRPSLRRPPAPPSQAAAKAFRTSRQGG